MPSTLRLYYDDPALHEFDAIVLACHRHGDGYRVALDRSAFYPTSGGQLHDTGLLRAGDNAITVLDVTVDDEGVVWHHVEQSLAEGMPLAGQVDMARRRDFRQQHSGQHVLSASFDHLIDARTESVHLGLESCTLDLHREVSADEVRRVEDHANSVVWDDRPVAIRHADAADLASEPRLRKATARTGSVRLIDIQGHDLSACGGTHVHRTGEIGVIAVRATERFRGGTRVTFLCGGRVLSSHRELRAAVDEVAQALSVAARDVPAAVARLRDDLREEQRRGKGLAERLTGMHAAALEAQVSNTGVLVAHLPDADAAALRQAASQLIATPGRVVALLGGDAAQALVVARSADRADVDAGAIVRRICAAHGGKGGGRPDLAQAGGVSADVEQVRASMGI
jgi:alanyl-tRNA synthetase